MKTLKRLALGIVLITAMGLAFASCSDTYYEDPAVPSHPIEGVPELPPIVDPR